MTSIERTQENKEISSKATEAYRKNGALLTLDPSEAILLINRGIGTHDPLGNYGHMVGLSVPPNKIDKYHAPGMLQLVGGVFIDRTRDRYDSILGTRRGERR